MRKLKVKTVKESLGLIKVYSNQTGQSKKTKGTTKNFAEKTKTDLPNAKDNTEKHKK